VRLDRIDPARETSIQIEARPGVPFFGTNEERGPVGPLSFSTLSGLP